jgi:hypothetical protein
LRHAETLRGIVMACHCHRETLWLVEDVFLRVFVVPNPSPCRDHLPRGGCISLSEGRGKTGLQTLVKTVPSCQKRMSACGNAVPERQSPRGRTPGFDNRSLITQWGAVGWLGGVAALRAECGPHWPCTPPPPRGQTPSGPMHKSPRSAPSLTTSSPRPWLPHRPEITASTPLCASAWPRSNDREGD